MPSQDQQRDWAPGRPRYASEAERRAARVRSTLRSRDREQYNAYMRKFQTKSHRKRRAKILTALGLKCAHCGYDKDWRALQVDHVRGNGAKERRTRGNWAKQMDKVLADTSGSYQLLCANCNYIKRYEQNEAHQNKEVEETVDFYLTELQQEGS